MSPSLVRNRDADMNRSGIELIEMMWKIMREEIPHCLDKKTELNVLVGISRTYDMTGYWEEALEKYELARQLAETIEENEMQANILRWMGHLRRKRGEWELAMRCNEKSLSICQRISYPLGEAYAYNNLGTNCFEMADWEKAAEYYDKSLAIAQDLREARLIAQINNNAGAMQHLRGNHEGAIVSYHQALLGYEREGDIRGLTQTYYNLALSFEERGEDVETTKNLEKGLELADDVGEKNLLAMLYLIKARVSGKAKDFTMALSFAELAMRVFEELVDQPGIADAHRVKGTIYRWQERYDEGESCFRESIRLNRALKSALGLAEALLEYGMLLRDRGDVKGAREAWRESKVLYTDMEHREKVRQIENLIEKLAAS